MKIWQRSVVAAGSFLLCLAAAQFAVRGEHQATGNKGFLGNDTSGVEGQTSDSASSGVYGTHLPTGNYGLLGNLTYGAAGVAHAADASGVLGSSGAGKGVQGVSTSGTGVYGSSTSGAGVYGTAAGSGIGVSGNTSSGTAVQGLATTGIGVRGQAFNGNGVYGQDLAFGKGVWGVTDAGSGVEGYAGTNGVAVAGTIVNNTGFGWAGYFNGRVHVNGTLSKSAGSFRIDHPLDPANKYLSHSFVESPDMKNIYDGVVTLDADGSATVELPEWFDALNKDFRYQLTCIGEHAPVFIARKVEGNQFRIAGGYAGLEVSWQVTGTRNDAYARAHRIPTEELKAPDEVGRYLHPALHGQSTALQITHERKRSR